MAKHSTSMGREKITFHKEWLDAVEALPDDMQGKVVLGLLRYGFKGEMPEGVLEGVIVQMAKPQMDADNQHFDNGCKGGRPKKEIRDKTPVNNHGFLGGTPNNTTTTTIRENDFNTDDDVVVDDLCVRMRAETTWVEAVCMNLHKDPAYIQQRLAEFCTEQKVQGVTTKSLGDAKRHFRSWLRKVEQIEAEQSRRGEPQNSGRPYPLFSYDEMLAEVQRRGGTTNDYAPVKIGGKPKPMWVRLADKTKFNIPDNIAS